MFGLSKKNSNGAVDFNEILSNPLVGMLLKKFNINLETAISEAAAAAKTTFEATGVPIFLMVALDDQGIGFDLGFYTQDNQGLQLLHSVNVTSVADAITQFSTLSATFKALSTNATQNNTTTEQPGAPNAQLPSPTSTEQPAADPLDQLDAE